MTVFPESMDRLDAGRVGESLAAIERYIRYMTERIEFAMGAGRQKTMEELQGELAALDRRIKALEDYGQ